MVRSKNVIGTISFVAMLLSVLVIGSGVWLAVEAKNSCVKILQWQVIILGTLILLVALAGVIGGFRRIQPLIVSYYIGMVIVIILLASLVVFIRRVAARGSGDPVPSRSYKEYHLSDFSSFLNKYHWDKITACLKSTSMCAELNQTYHTAQDFFSAHITPFQSGCCTPPIQYGYTYLNPTYWVRSTNYNKSMVVECQGWTNDKKELCYACNFCRAGLLHNLTTQWRKDLIFPT